MKTQLLKSVLLLSAVLVGSAIYAAADTTWDLLNVTFSDGASATGHFTFNSTFTAVTDWDISVVGSSLGADYHYTPANSNNFYPSPTEIAFGSNPFAEFIFLTPSSPMTNAGGTIPLLTGGASVDCSASGACGGLVTGQISGTTTTLAEPASLALLGSGITLLGIRMRKRIPKLQ